MSTSNGRRRYAKIEEAAEYLRVNKATIRAMTADGRLTRYMLGPRIMRVDLDEIDAVMVTDPDDPATIESQRKMHRERMAAARKAKKTAREATAPRTAANDGAA